MPSMGFTPEMENMMLMLDELMKPAMQNKLRAAGIDPEQAREEFLSEMKSMSEYNTSRSPFAEGFTGRIGNPDPVRAPWRGEYDMSGNFERRQDMADSMANDARLGMELGYSRKRGKDENEPEGSYLLSNYPGAAQDINMVEQGLGSWGHAANFMDSHERMALEQKAKAWAEHQRKLLGINTESPDDFRARNRASGGRSGRDRMRYLMRRR